jgi:hypothetical protein
LEALTLQVFVSLCLAAGGVMLFLFSGKWRDVEHADRLALIPIEDERTLPHVPVAHSEAPTSEPRKPVGPADTSVSR